MERKDNYLEHLLKLHIRIITLLFLSIKHILPELVLCVEQHLSCVFILTRAPLVRKGMGVPPVWTQNLQSPWLARNSLYTSDSPCPASLSQIRFSLMVFMFPAKPSWQSAALTRPLPPGTKLGTGAACTKPVSNSSSSAACKLRIMGKQGRDTCKTFSESPPSHAIPLHRIVQQNRTARPRNDIFFLSTASSVKLGGCKTYWLF